jgi:hypothetical protein
LPDQRVLLVYGYRHQPLGTGARVLGAECNNVGNAPEIVPRDDGGTGDRVYPWTVLMKDGRVPEAARDLDVQFSRFSTADGTSN